MATAPQSAAPVVPTAISKKKKIVQQGIFHAELNDFLERELFEDGYAGVEIRSMPTRTEIIIRATRTKEVLGEKGRRIRELTTLVQQRWGFKEGSVELFAERVMNRATCAVAQAESVRYKLMHGLPVRRACYGVLRFIMEQGAKGCEIVVSGKLRAQRAKVQKFNAGYRLKAGAIVDHYVDTAVRHVLMRQGVLGVRVSIMKPHDPTGRNGVAVLQPDVIKVYEPKEDGTGPIREEPETAEVDDRRAGRGRGRGRGGPGGRGRGRGRF